jgi:8-oxo-dGTP pyrophosphatase MutT (NUDIX family)
MRRRPSARLLVLDTAGRVLLFRFVHRTGVLAGREYWATPGGGVEDGETFQQAAIRELREETGIVVDAVGPEVGQREFDLQLPNGEWVSSDERFFRVEFCGEFVSRDGWTPEEIEVMADHKWWSIDELSQTAETVWPEGLAAMLTASESSIRRKRAPDAR